MIAFPWFLATAVGLMWAASARKNNKLPPGVPPGSIEVHPLEPAPIGGSTTNPNFGTLPITLPPLFPIVPPGNGASQLPPPGGGASSPPPSFTVGPPPPFSSVSPGQPTGRPKPAKPPSFGTMPVGGEQPILVSAPPPGAIEVPGLAPGLPPIRVEVPPPGAIPIAPPTPVIKVPAQPPGTVPVKPPATPVVTHPNSRAALASEAYRMLMNSVPSQSVKDPTLLKAYQRQEGLDSSGVYGPGTGKSFIKYNFVPPKPFNWGKSVEANKDNWRDNMLTMARKDPQRRDEWEEAAQV